MSTTTTAGTSRQAMRRLLGLKLLGVPRALWNQVRRGLLRVVRLPRAVATGGLALLATSVGYQFVVKAAGTAVRAAATVIRQITRLVAKPLRWLGRGVARLVGLVSPKAERTLRTATAKVMAPVRRAATWTGTVLSTVGRTVEALAHAPLVRRTATATAAVGGAVVAAYTVGNGVVAAKAAAMLPAAARLLAAVANPWVALGMVGAATLAAMGVTFARALRALREEAAPEPEAARVADPGPAADPAQGRPVQATVTEPPAEGTDADAPAPASTGAVFTAKDATGMALAARSLHVHLDGDSAVTVDSIPATLPGHVAEHVARVAADAAIAQLQRLQALRTTLSRDDRRLLTKVAREAVAAEARRLASGQQPIPHAA